MPEQGDAAGACTGAPGRTRGLARQATNMLEKARHASKEACAAPQESLVHRAAEVLEKAGMHGGGKVTCTERRHARRTAGDLGGQLELGVQAGRERGAHLTRQQLQAEVHVRVAVVLAVVRQNRRARLVALGLNQALQELLVVLRPLAHRQLRDLQRRIVHLRAHAWHRRARSGTDMPASGNALLDPS